MNLGLPRLRWTWGPRGIYPAWTVHRPGLPSWGACGYNFVDIINVFFFLEILDTDRPGWVMVSYGIMIETNSS